MSYLPVALLCYLVSAFASSQSTPPDSFSADAAESPQHRVLRVRVASLEAEYTSLADQYRALVSQKDELAIALKQLNDRTEDFNKRTDAMNKEAEAALKRRDMKRYTAILEENVSRPLPDSSKEVAEIRIKSRSIDRQLSSLEDEQATLKKKLTVQSKRLEFVDRCTRHYNSTIDKKHSDLTVKEVENIKACKY